MITLVRTQEFADWLSSLRDHVAQARILARIAAASAGNFGDCKPVGGGVTEMRVHAGAGYRVYFVREASVVYVLLCGGSKSTQERDIARAKDLAARIARSRKEFK